MKKFFMLGFMASGLLLFGVTVQAEDNQVEVPQGSLLSASSQTLLELVDFQLTADPEVVMPSQLVDFNFSLKNTGTWDIENARITFQLPFGISFVDEYFFAGQAVIESNNNFNDTLIIRGINLSAQMDSPFEFSFVAQASDLIEQETFFAQAVLDVVNSDNYAVIFSDAETNTANANEKTAVTVSSTNTAPVITPAARLAASTFNNNISKSYGKVVTGSGKKGSRWSGMLRGEFQKASTAITAEKSKTYVSTVNAGRSYQVKTYVDRNGKVKFNGIEKGKLPANLTYTTKKKPILRNTQPKVAPKATGTTLTPTIRTGNTKSPFYRLRNPLR